MPELDALLSGFVTVGWSSCLEAIPSEAGTHIYVLLVRVGDDAIPLYVGQTCRLAGRIGDYQTAQFQAPTDFRVGEAVRYLTGPKGCQVDLLYRTSASRRKDEKLLIRELLLSGYTLLNFLGAFDYNETSAVAEREIVHRFCDMMLNMEALRPLAK
jgi:hypothetical protein